MTEEIWKNVQVYRKGILLKFDDYQVEYYTQRVKSFKRYKEGRILKPQLDRVGYPDLSLRYNQKDVNLNLHKIVADTFIPNPENLPEVNHKNGIKTDCRVENLERCTHSQNIQHAYDVLGIKSTKGEINGQAKLTEAKVKKICRLLDAGKLTHQQIGDIYGVTGSAISCIQYGKSWSHLTKRVHTKKLNGRSNLSEAEVIEIYNLTWFSGLKLKEIGKKYGLSVGSVASIKLGYSWTSVTGHIRNHPAINHGTTESLKSKFPSLFNSQEVEPLQPLNVDITDLDYWLGV
jgi:hypothetical protein